MKNPSKKILFATLALSFGASQSISVNFDLKEIQSSKGLIVHNIPGLEHDELDSTCGKKHSQILTNLQAKYEQQQDKKKKKTKKTTDSDTRLQVEDGEEE